MADANGQSGPLTVVGVCKLTRSQIALLRQIGNDDVGWKGDLGGRISYRLWLTEDDYKTITPQVKRLVGLGLASRWHNPAHFGRGGVGLTPMGRQAIKEVSVD